jgi:hypothetical protein
VGPGAELDILISNLKKIERFRGNLIFPSLIKYQVRFERGSMARAANRYLATAAGQGIRRRSRHEHTFRMRTFEATVHYHEYIIAEEE